MNLLDTFTTTAHAKCILSGEHAVLRGYPALVFPVPQKYLTLSFEPGDQPVDVVCSGDYSDTLRLLFWGLLEESLKQVQKKHDALRGKFTLLNTIPMGAGLGFSAALCVAVSRWILACGWIEKDNLFAFSRQLENHFHGKSSGVDIAGALCQSPVYFTQEAGIIETIQLSWKPHLYLSHSSQVSITAQCIEAVNSIWQHQPILARSIDKLMQESVEDAKMALTMPVPDKTMKTMALTKLASAINKANSCFEQWGLNKGLVKEHLDQLTKQGALAAKSTGAGNGGFVISLWENTPHQYIQFKMLAIT